MAGRKQLVRIRLKKIKTLLGAGRLGEAAKLCEKLSLGGADPQAYSLLADIYARQGRNAEALAALQQTVEVSPADAAGHARLADSLLQSGRLDQALLHLKRAAELCPEDPKTLSNYAAILLRTQRNAEAEPYLRAALRINPKLPQLYTNLGSCLRAQGKIEESLSCYEDGLVHAPADPVMHSNYLMACQYSTALDGAAKKLAHQAWAERHMIRGNSFAYREQACTLADAKLRIGYVSPDFRTHSVAYYLLPLLENHNRDEVDIYCYSNVIRPDAMTQRLQKLSDSWCDASGMNDVELVRRISNDGINILVDLAGHTAGNRLQVFAYKPAPVQATWLGYPDTTGVPTIDYRITDALADPAGFEKFCVEELLRIQGCFLCYEPPSNAPEVAASPCTGNGVITFGSFNNLSKINSGVLEAWACILERVPGSNLYIKNPGLTDPLARDRLYAFFKRRGINASRLTLRGLNFSTAEHLAEYGNVDIALDTFPYNGVTTTCEALWMGVPVLTLTGEQHANCVGSSLLTAAELGDWIANTVDEYISKAVDLATDCSAVAGLRERVRATLKESALCDGKGFAGRMEAIYRRMWSERRRSLSSEYQAK